jgi:secondary thiamine-phosphate synthase enzyme
MPGSRASIAAANTPPVCTVLIVPECRQCLKAGLFFERGFVAAAMAVFPGPRAGYTLLVDVSQHELELASDGHGHVYDLTEEVVAWLRSIAAVEGQLTVFVPGSTAVITTIEFEPGAVRDLVEALERLAPSDRSYHHDLRWGDGNGFSHLRAALLGPSLTVPVARGRCVLGTWQQIVLAECDLAPRRRRVVLSFVGLCDQEA